MPSVYSTLLTCSTSTNVTFFLVHRSMQARPRCAPRQGDCLRTGRRHGQQGVPPSPDVIVGRSQDDDPTPERERASPRLASFQVLSGKAPTCSGGQTCLLHADFTGHRIPPTANALLATIRQQADISPLVLLSPRENQTTLLLATPHHCRGLDLPAVSHVYNLNAPETATAYIHQAGRTGRVGFDAGERSHGLRLLVMGQWNLHT